MNKTITTMTVAALCAAVPVQAADPVAEFYKGKDLFVQVGSGAGGGYDLYARLVARHWAKYIPGNPRVIVQNIPGGGSLRLANQFGNVTPRDGTYVGVMSNGMPSTPLLTPDAAQYDARQFGMVGSPTAEKQLLAVWHTAPAKKLEDIYTTELIVGASSPGSPTFDYPLLTNAVLGTKFKIVTGYEGSNNVVRLAMPRGEIHANAAISLGSYKTTYNDLVKSKELLIFAQYGFDRHPDIPDIPLMPTGKNDSERQMFELMYSRERYGRLFVTPPGLPAERLRALRDSFDATLRDKDFLAEAEKSNTDIELVRGEELQALTDRVYKATPDVLKRMRALLDTKVEAKKE